VPKRDTDETAGEDLASIRGGRLGRGNRGAINSAAPNRRRSQVLFLTHPP
jgi:hypothetical protein